MNQKEKCKKAISKSLLLTISFIIIILGLLVLPEIFDHYWALAGFPLVFAGYMLILKIYKKN